MSSGDLLAFLPIAEAAAKVLGLSIEWDGDDGADTLEATCRYVRDTGCSCTAGHWRRWLEVTCSETRENHTGEELQQLFHALLFLKRGYPVIQNVRPDGAYMVHVDGAMDWCASW